MAQSYQKVESLRTLLGQHWGHCQHLESERAWFMSIYGAVAGGILAFSATGFDTSSPFFYALISFLIVITFFGFFLTLRWTYAFEAHRKRVRTILTNLKLNKLELNGEMVDVTMDILAGGLFKVFKTKFLFPLFYLAVLIGITWLLCFVIEASTWSKWLLFVVPLAALLLGVWWYFSLKEMENGKRDSP